MSKKFLFWSMAAAFCMGSALISCSDNNEPGGDGTEGKPDAEGSYVIAATVGGVNYLLKANSLDEGSITTVGEGLETESGTYWVFHGKDYLFRLVYNKGAAGTGASYIMDNNYELEEYMTYSFNRVTTYGVWGDNVITSSTGDTDKKDSEGNVAQGFLVNYLSATQGTVNPKTYEGENYLGNGEYVSFSGFVEANGHLYTSVIPMGMSQYGVKNFPDKITDRDLIAKESGGSGSGSYDAGEIPSTQYPDSAFIAIYSGDSFDEKPVIARTGKIGFASGRMRSQYYQTIWVADNGDLYVFSPGYGRLTTSSADLKRVEGKLPSGVVRIKAGEKDFDKDYYVNLEEVGPKHPVYKCWHITEDYFLLQLYTEGLKSKGEGTTELAIFKGSDKSVKVVTGLPSEEVIASFGNIPYSENGYAYMPVITTDGNMAALYKIDPKTATATKGLSIEAETISTAGWLNAQK